MSRFFKKSKYINDISDQEIHQFLDKEGLSGKVEVGRVKDFYNGLSTISDEGKLFQEDTIKYHDDFNATTSEDIDVVNELRSDERTYLESLSGDILNSSRLLKAAVALSYKFEKDRYAGDDKPSDNNTYLKNLFNYHEDKENSKSTTFGEMLQMDLSFFKYLALLSTKKAFSRDQGKLERNSAGNTVKYKPMESIQDAINMDLIQCVMPDFNRKMATEDLYVRQRFIRTERAQNLIILVDDSGSMGSTVKISMLNAALTLKLRDHSEHHNVYVGTFENQVYGFIKVKSGMKIKDLTHIKLDKGGTDVNGCIKSTIENIKKRTLPNINRYDESHKLSSDHFEIMVINDGSDRVDPTYHPQIKIHAICLVTSNKELKNICHRSGGTYNHLEGKG